jgi:diguanylate cyclase (GGDEF)-like protein
MAVVEPPGVRALLRDVLPSLAMAVLLALFGFLVVAVAGGEWRAHDVPLSSLHAPAQDSDSQRSHGNGVAMRMQLALPARQPGQARRMIWLSRDPADAVWLQGTGWRSPTLRFFAPGAGEGLVPGAFLFPLPDAAVDTLELHATGPGAARPTPRLVAEDEAARWQQRVVALNVLVYASVFVLALMAAWLLWTVRERFFLVLAAAAVLVGLMCAAANGHLYTIAGLRAFGALGAHGFWALCLLCTATLLALLQQFAAGTPAPLRARWIRVTIAVQCLLALLLALRPEPLSHWALPLLELGGVASAIIAVLLLVGALRNAVPMALPVLFVLLIVFAAAAARIGLLHGWLPDIAWTRYGYQLALSALLVVVALGLVARIGDYREQRDREHDARLTSERRMQREAGRAALTRALQARLRELPPEDLEWTAFRLLLEHLLPHVPAERAVVLARDYHGRDVVASEPIDSRQIVSGLEGTRLLALRRLVMAGRALQRDVEVDGRRWVEAVVPAPVAAPAWSVLLLQRPAGADFDDEELAAAAEFLRLAVLHVDEAQANQALRRTAEIDALTGTVNRRSIDLWLARHFSPRNQHKALSVLFVDIDHFKRVNDLHGHACGDHCLRSVAAALRAVLRAHDVLGRYGGEEFIALLPRTDLAAARGLAERLRIAVEDCSIEWQGTALRVSVSIGVATRAPDEDAAPLLERADRALYVAKRQGRNRTAVSDTPLHR